MILKYLKVAIFALIASSAFAQQPLSFSMDAPGGVPTPNGTYDVEVRVSDFRDIVGAQLAFLWDSSVIQIDTIPFVTTALSDFNTGSLLLPEQAGTPIKGRLRFSWFSFSLAPQTLPDDTHLFTMRFNVVGSPCDTTTIQVGDIPPFVPIEVTQEGAAKDNIGAEGSFLVEIPGTDCGTIDPPPPPPNEDCPDDEMSLIFGEVSVESGDVVCMPLTVTNFNSVETFQGSIMWDSAVLTFSSSQAYALPGLNPSSFGINAVTGVSTFIWFDNSGGGNAQTLADGETVFEICFDVIGSTGSKSTVKVFEGNPAMGEAIIQVSTSNGLAEVCPQVGCVNVGGVPPPSDDFTLIAEDITINESQTTVCNEVSVENFDDIVGMQFTMTWDPAILCYDSVTDLNSDLEIFGSFFNPTGDDRLRFSWTGTPPRTVPDGTVLFSVCYDVKPNNCDNTSPFDFIDDGQFFRIEIAEIGDVQIDSEVRNGSVIIDCGPDPRPMVNSSVTDVLCNGDTTGRIDLSITGVGPFSCVWTGPGGFSQTDTNVSSSCSASDLVAGTYNIIVTGSNNESRTVPVIVGEPSAIVISGNTSPQTDTGLGSITHNVQGGTGTLNESWTSNYSGNGSNLEAGFYTLVVTDDNGCTESRVFEIEDETSDEFPPIRVSWIITDSECGDDGQICITCSGGSGSFLRPTITPNTGSWDPVTECYVNVPAGRYTMKCIDAVTGGDAERSDDVRQLNPRTIRIDIDNLQAGDCDTDGSFDINVSGGCPNYRITIGIEGENDKRTYNPNRSYAPGDYEVCVEDSNGNTRTRTFTLPAPGRRPEIDVELISDAECGQDGSIEITITDGCDPDCVIKNLDTGQEIACESGDIVNLPAGNYQACATDDMTGDASPVSFDIRSDGSGDPIEIRSIEFIDAPCNGIDGAAILEIVNQCGELKCTIDIGNDGSIQDCELINGRVDVPVGSHTITITDCGTNTTASASILVETADNAFSVRVESVTSSSVDITAVDGTSPYTFQWTGPNMFSSNSEDLDNLTEAGIYTLIASDAMGCEIVTEVTVPEPGDDTLTLTVDNNSFVESLCARENAACDGSFAGFISGGVAPYIVVITDQFGNVSTFNVQSDGVFVLDEICGGSYVVTIEDSAGTMFDYENPVIIDGPEPIIIEEDLINCADPGESNGSVSAIVTGGAGGLEFDWTPDLPEAGPTNEDLPEGNYLLTVRDVNGCEAEFLFTVESCTASGDCHMGLSVMTPNGDNANDVFVINCAESIPNQLSVYDRWGRAVFEQTDYQNNWNGTDLEGEPLMEGAYYWVYQADNQLFKGTVTLLRD